MRTAARVFWLTVIALAFLPAAANASTSAAGDFNGDSFADLAVGVPGESVGAVPAAGAVNVLYGSASGLGAANSQLWHQNSAGIMGTAIDDDAFGTAVAAGDMDGDGFADLAVGVPNEFPGGAVVVIYGSASGLSPAGDQRWTQDSPSIAEEIEEVNERFGETLATGDLDGDGFADLAVGVPGESVTGVPAAGAVNVIYGSGSGLAAPNNQIWHQERPSIADTAEQDEGFGKALATGDLDGDSFEELAVGVPSESAGAVAVAGAANVIYGSASGLTSTGAQFWHQDSAGIPEDAAAGDHFGTALTTGDFDNDNRADLVVGAKDESIGAVLAAGSANVIYGSVTGLNSSGAQLWHQNVAGIAEQSEDSDQFSFALAAGDFDNDGVDDLAAGVPQESLGETAGGAVNVLYGVGTSGLGSADDQIWHQDIPGIAELAEGGDQFGWALAAGRMDGPGSVDLGSVDLAVGVPLESIAGAPVVPNAGAVNAIYGSAAGLSSTANRAWHQDVPGIVEAAETDDGFGKSLASGAPLKAG